MFFRYLLCAVCSIGGITVAISAQASRSIILDADTGNEVDDLYAIVRAVIEPELTILALNATQWQPSHWSVPESMENSYRINQKLLGYLGKSGEIPSLRGGVDRLYDWGDRAQYSASANHIIKRALETKPGEKLDVIALGALTNVASAILIEPAIQDRIRLYWLGTTYDFAENVLRKRDFNCVMDIQAVGELFDSNVEMHVLPVSVARALTFDFDEMLARIGRSTRLTDYLITRWEQHLDAGRQSRVLWDLGIVLAYLYPDMAEEVSIKTSKENGDREVYYYRSLDADAMRRDFYAKMKIYLE